MKRLLILLFFLLVNLDALTQQKEISNNKTNEIKYFGGKKMYYDNKELSIKDAIKLSEKMGNVDAATFFRKARKRKAGLIVLSVFTPIIQYITLIYSNYLLQNST